MPDYIPKYVSITPQKRMKEKTNKDRWKIVRMIFWLLPGLRTVSNLICGLYGKKQIERMFMKFSFDCSVRFFTARIREKILQIVFSCVRGADRGYALLP